MYVSTARSLLLILLIVSIIGIGLFLSGFLLTKTEIRQKSSPSEHSDLFQIFKDTGIHEGSKYQSLLQHYSPNSSSSSNVKEKKEEKEVKEGKRVFLFVIDALRFDFFQPNTDMEIMCEKTMNLDTYHNINEKPMKRNITFFTKDELLTLRYKHNNNFPDIPKLNYTSCIYNQFPKLHELLLKDSHYTRLYKAYSDPPTTTLQRLKGITTGSIPAFIEFSNNFDNTIIHNEDSIIHQALSVGKKIAVIGDDTWGKIFPSEQFDLNLPFDSFNTMDLDTVDDGVENALNELISNNTLLQYDLIIAHFLGVDHIGHTHNAFDILMGER